MNRGVGLLSAAGLGAGLMFFFDPALGRRRRVRIRDKTIHMFTRADGLINKTGRDLAQRAAGLVAEASARFRGKTVVPDEVLIERVRSKVGRVCSHPRSLEFHVRQGRVTLSGPILAEDVPDVLRAAASVRGVCAVEDRFEIHEEAGTVSGLQGKGRRPGDRIDLLQRRWAPATRLLSGAVGCGLMVNCLARRTPLAALFGTAGFALFLRGLTNLEFKQLLGFGDGREGIHFLKTLTVYAPVERVFAFWSDFTNFPHFMTHVREVRDLGGGRSRWTVEGPARVPIHWDAILTRSVPERELAWESVPGSPVSHAGVVQFQPNADGSTRIQLRLSYLPPAGVLGHAVAALFAVDPKREMDDDLMRMKSFLETGIPAHDAAYPDGRRRKNTHRIRPPGMPRALRSR
jgi:uncharacterized membrane protein